jgi:hypothetical protein
MRTPAPQAEGKVGPSFYRIFNQGQIAGLAKPAPAKAGGWRSVIALTPGRKWITVVDWATLETGRVTLDLWKRLHPLPVTDYSLRRVRKVMKARLAHVKNTKAISAATALLHAAS